MIVADQQEWLIEIEALSYLILWDYDFEDEDLYIDKPPEEAKRLKDFMRIRDAYFRGIPDDLESDQINIRLSELKCLCRSVCEKTKATWLLGSFSTDAPLNLTKPLSEACFKIKME